jgi:hypothetical protein
MRVDKYGISLHRLTENDIELVRFHRNSDFIRTKMFYQKHISEEEQQNWFQSINNDWNYYFLIRYSDTIVGMVHGTINSYEEKTAKGGLFIWDEKALKSHLPVIASVVTTDLTFFVMQMENTTAEVRNTNKTAINYNLSLGYTIEWEDKKTHKVFMNLTKENYLRSAKQIRSLVKKISKDPSELSWNDITFPNPLPPGLYKKLPLYLSNNLKIKTKNF